MAKKPTKKPTQKKRAKKEKGKKSLKRYLLRLGLLFVGAFVLCLIVFWTVLQLTPFDPTPLQKSSEPTVIYAKDGSVYAKISSGETDLQYSQIPQDLQDAIVATEDHNFWHSSSIDVRGLLRAAFVDLWSEHLAQGGSTIPEQLAKIVYLNQEKTFSRKFQQIALGVQIQRHYTKPEILTMYLNKVYLGENSIGVQQAAMRYFGVDLTKPHSTLTIAQAAMLAGLPQAPSAYDPLQNPKLALERRNEVLDNMAKYGYLTQAKADQIKKQPLGAKFHDLNGDAWDQHPLFTNFLFDYANRQGITTEELLQGGLKVYTTVDPKVQGAIDKVFWDDVNPSDFPSDMNGHEVEGAALFIDPKTGGILGGAGSRKQGYAKFGWDRIYRPSEPGSSIKPVMEYAPAIESGNWTPNSILDNTPHDFGGGYIPQNDDPNAPRKIALKDALRLSQNVASVWLLQQIGIQTGTSFAEKDGIALDPSDKQSLTVAIGGMKYGVTPYEMAQAYEPFDNNGVQMQAHLITRIVNQAGEDIYQYTPVQKQIMSAQTAATMTQMMQAVVTNGTGVSAQVPGWQVAGKTGTVQYNAGLTGAHNDWVSRVWFDGYTPNMVGSVYLGFDSTTPTYHLNWYPYPGTYTAKIFADITAMSEQGVTPIPFTFPKAAPTPPKQPTSQATVQDLTASWDSTQNGILLDWSGSGGSSASQTYTVSRLDLVPGQGGSQSVGNSNTLVQTTDTSYEDTSVQAGMTYTYMVQAVDPKTATPLGPPATVTFTVPGGTPSTPDNSVGNTPGNTPGFGNNTTTDNSPWADNNTVQGNDPSPPPDLGNSTNQQSWTNESGDGSDSNSFANN